MSSEDEIRGRIEDALERTLGDLAVGTRLRRAMEHALLGGGKRIRPLLCVEACRCVGAPAQRAIRAGVAIEMVHAFSLVHDDLPVMDDDDLRRGLPTVHVAFDEATAILAGDALLNGAYRVLCGPDAGPGTSLIEELSEATARMIEGQMLDITGSARTIEDVRRVHELKTGSLMRCACRMGAICGGADEETIEQLGSFGLHLGLLFQATDDLIDAEQAEETAGKATGKDAALGRPTLVGLLGVDGTRDEVVHLVGVCRDLLDGLDGGRLLSLCERIASRTR